MDCFDFELHASSISFDLLMMEFVTMMRFVLTTHMF